ncbi:MAG: DUF1961 family protein [bacterium]|nr:DUF1961 family protein [bacterium]
MSLLLPRREFVALASGVIALAQEPRRGRLLYESAMSSARSTAGWEMEGPGKVSFSDGWMRMWSPGERMHHVYWCPETFPANFEAQWEGQNLHQEAGLCIAFFCAMGLNGKDVRDPSQPKRDGTFKQYHSGALRNYHISYYANTPQVPNRAHAHLRRNPGFAMVQQGPRGIPVGSDAVHRMRLRRMGARIHFLIDDREIINWTDPEPHAGGRMALRQMQWTQFRYRNFRVWELS